MLCVKNRYFVHFFKNSVILITNQYIVTMRTLLLAVSLVSMQIIYGQTTRKYSNEFLNIGVDAAALGMGNTVVSNVQDLTAGYWNPAGLVAVKDYQGALMHAAYFANIAQYDYAGFAMPLDKNSALGFSLLRFGVDDILDTTELIDNQGNIDYNRINLFAAADYALQISFARKPIIKDMYWGVSAKIIHRRIGKFATSYGFGLDAGWQLNKEDWHYGIMIRDITTTFNVWHIDETAFNAIKDAIPGENQELPETTELTLPKAQLGVTRDWELTRDLQLQTALDLNIRFTKTNAIINSNFASIEPAFGFQANYLEMVFLRGGINNLQQETQFDNSTRISWQPNFGVGFKYNGIQIDYALTNIASTGNALYSNIFSVKIDFGAFR